MADWARPAERGAGYCVSEKGGECALNDFYKCGDWARPEDAVWLLICSEELGYCRAVILDKAMKMEYKVTLLKNAP